MPNQPIFSRMQIIAGEGPDIYRPSPYSPVSLTSLYGRFMWHHHDLCLFHQSLYAQVRERDMALDTLVKKTRPPFEQHNRENLDNEWEAVQLSRLRETFNVHHAETESIKTFGDQLLAIALWAMVEQYCGRTLIAVEHALKGKGQYASSPHRWHDMVKRFADVGIDLSRCKSAKEIDECRVLNNKIKHVGVVDGELTQLNDFHEDTGKPLERVTFPLQKYSNAVFEFVGCVMEEAGNLLKPTEAPL